MAKEARFPYNELYRRLEVMDRLFSSTAEPPWLKQRIATPPPHRVALRLGCQILRTPPLAEACTRVVEKLHAAEAEDPLLTITWLPFCCGASHAGQGDVQSGDAMRKSMLDYLRGAGTETVLNWCGTCQERLHDQGESARGSPLQIQHISEYILDRLDRLQFVRPQPLRVAFHRHEGAAGQDHQYRCIRRVLEAIPGIQVVETPPKATLRPRHCSRLSLVKQIGLARLREVLAGELAQARELGADAICAISHPCYRELVAHRAEYAPDSPVRVTNWVLILAAALGIDVDGTYERVAALGDGDAILPCLLPRAEAAGISRAEAEAVVRLEFEEHQYVSDRRWWPPAK